MTVLPCSIYQRCVEVRRSGGRFVPWYGAGAWRKRLLIWRGWLPCWRPTGTVTDCCLTWAYSATWSTTPGSYSSSMRLSWAPPWAAVGFGVGLDRIHASVLEQGGDVDSGLVLVLMPGAHSRWVKVADLLRTGGVGVFALPEETDEEKMFTLARQKEIRLLVEPDPMAQGEGWMVRDLERALESRCFTDQLVEEIRRISAAGDVGMA